MEKCSTNTEYLNAWNCIRTAFFSFPSLTFNITPKQDKNECPISRSLCSTFDVI